MTGMNESYENYLLDRQDIENLLPPLKMFET